MRLFIDWYASLAPEGETMIIVRQKQKANGQWAYFAALPDRWKPDVAYYGNVGSYIVDRFTDGKPVAQARCIERVAVLVLDDIGTKSKTPPLAPTWKMETSPGNEQWCYVFALDDQPTKGEYQAAIRAIAEAGFTDPGATNAVRNFRLPGSVNLKPGKDNFQSRLIEWHREREFTLPQICQALGVEPGDPVKDIDPITLADTGSDIVVRWLNEQSLVLDPPNGSGWMGIQCPNCEAHSDGNLEGRYSPATRAYKCLHAHCVDWTSERFLRWVEEQGGPRCTPGLRDELLAEAMQGALQAITPSEAFPDRVAEAVAEVERREIGRLQKAEWFARFAYVISDDSYFDLEERTELTRNGFNALFRHVECHSIHRNSTGGGRRIEAATSFDEHRQAMGARVVNGITYAPGDAALVAWGGNVFANRWRNARRVYDTDGDISPWLEHVEKLIPNEVEREHVFNVMACKLQQPGTKINHAVLHGGTAGAGKDTLWLPFIRAICGFPETNHGKLTMSTISSQFHYDLEAEIVSLTELKEPEAKERRALSNALKPLIAAPPEFVTINRKGLHPYTAPNRFFVLAHTNYMLPLSLDSDDRRWFCIWSSAPPMTTAEHTRMLAWYSAVGYDRIATWLMRRDVSAFVPGAAPPATDWKALLIDNSRSSAEAIAVEMIQNRQGPFAKGVIAGPFHAICELVGAHAPSGMRFYPPVIIQALRDAKWIDLGMVKTREYQTKKNLWAAPGLVESGASKSDLRRIVEDAALLSVVQQSPQDKGRHVAE